MSNEFNPVDKDGKLIISADNSYTCNQLLIDSQTNPKIANPRQFNSLNTAKTLNEKKKRTYKLDGRNLE